jgi:hypothetical protein
VALDRRASGSQVLAAKRPPPFEVVVDEVIEKDPIHATIMPRCERYRSNSYFPGHRCIAGAPLHRRYGPGGRPRRTAPEGDCSAVQDTDPVATRAVDLSSTTRSTSSWPSVPKEHPGFGFETRGSPVAALEQATRFGPSAFRTAAGSSSGRVRPSQSPTNAASSSGHTRRPNRDAPLPPARPRSSWTRRRARIPHQ